MKTPIFKNCPACKGAFEEARSSLGYVTFECSCKFTFVQYHYKDTNQTLIAELSTIVNGDIYYLTPGSNNIWYYIIFSIKDFHAINANFFDRSVLGSFTYDEIYDFLSKSEKEIKEYIENIEILS